jgi:hypothetical protein
VTSSPEEGKELIMHSVLNRISSTRDMLAGIAVVLTFATVESVKTVSAEEPTKAQIEAMRAALKKYQDPYVAVRDLYMSAVGCIHFDGKKQAGYMEYDKGAMGVHFVNLTIKGPPDPMHPNVLVYEPDGKKLKLVAAEWLVPLAVAKGRPHLFGIPFEGPMEGHEPLIKQDFAHYDLHVWLFKDNPRGMFAASNPNVSCDGADYSLLAEPTKAVPEPVQ